MANLNRHIKSDTIKWVIVFILIAALIAGVIALAWSSTNWFDWAKPDDQVEEEENQDNIDNERKTPEPDSDVVVVDGQQNDVIAMPHALSFSPLALSETDGYEEKSVTVSVNIMPDNATDKTIIWDIAWKDSSVTKNIGDYFTVEKVDEISATLTCLQPCAEEVVLKATSESNRTVSASCAVYCLKRIKSVDLRLGSYGSSDTVTPNNFNCVLGSASQCMFFDVNYYVGSDKYAETLNVEKNVSIKLVNNSTIENNFRSLNTGGFGITYTGTYDFTRPSSLLNYDDDFCKTVFGNYAWTTNKNKTVKFINDFENGKYLPVGDATNMLNYEVTVTGNYGFTQTITFNCHVDISNYVTAVDSIDLDNSEVIF